MNMKEILKILQLKKGKKGGIVLICIASILAFLSAIYGAFRFGKKKGANESEKLRSRSASDSNVEEQLKTMTDEIKSVVYKVAAPQPTYVVRPLEEKKFESRGKRFRRHMYAAASAILLITMVGSTAMQSVETTTSLARESFSGIGEIVKDHDDDPYIILDIVPADATYSDNYIFSIGTMGYLVNGQASISKSIENIFKNKKETFYDYNKRKELIDGIILSDNTLGVKYEEAYGGVDAIPEHAGWIQIFDETDVLDDDDSIIDGNTTDGSDDDDTDEDDDSSTGSLTYATGRFYGTAEPVDDGEGDYISTTGRSLRKIRMINPEEGTLEDIYTHKGDGGNYRLKFEPMDPGEHVGGYVIIGSEEPAAVSSTSWLYRIGEDGYYTPVAIKGEFIDDVYDITSVPEDEEGIGDEETEGEDETGEGEGNGADTGAGDGDGADTGEGEGGGADEGEGGGAGEGEGGGADAGEGGGTGEGEGGGTDAGEGGGTDAGEGGGAGEGEGGGTDAGEGGEETEDEDSGANEVQTRRISDPWIIPSSDAGTLLVNNTIFSDSWRLLVEENETVKDIREELGSEYDNYKALKFEYRPNPTPEDKLYWPVRKDPINNKDVPCPYDAYNKDDEIEFDLSELEEDSVDSDPYATAMLALEDFDTDIDTDISTDKYIYVGPGKGDYKLTRTNKETGNLIEVQRAPVYFRCTANKDWIKEYVFCTLSDGDNKNDDFEIEVITKRADEVDAYDVKNADLIFLESEVNNVVLNTGDTGNLELKYINSDYSGYGDMPDAAAAQILRSAVDDLKPVIVDYDIVDSKNYGEKSTYQYLAKAFLKDDLEEFVGKIDKDGNLIGNLKTNTNVENSDDYPNKNINDNNYVNRNIYIVNDDTPLVSEDFRDPFDRGKARAGFSEVLNAIKAENTTLSDDDEISDRVSKARAVQYIINYSVGIIGEFEDLRILEIQPSANSEPDLYQEDDGKKLVWKTESMASAKQILFSRKEFNAKVDVKSVVEFNGEWEDINGKYDMIFIGLDGQRLNLDDDGRTVYNKEELKGLVYHSGDNSDSGLGQYDANDLTAQKMDELLEFMKAGYPIVVEDNCFKKRSAQDSGKDGINPYYIGEGTVMERFLQAAVGESDYEDYIFSVSDVTLSSSATFMTQMRISKPRISLMDEVGEAASRVQLLPLDENGEYHGLIYYKIENNRGGDYVGNPVVKVYADYNYDGYFVPSEEMTEVINDGSMLDVRIDGMGPGILPYKIEVSDEGNAYRRSSVQGYFYLGITADDEMKVLQITEKKNTEKQKGNAVDLEWMFNTVENSMLAYFLQSAEAGYDMEMQFETVTSSELEKELDSNAKYLEQYDVVVLTLDGAASSSAVAEAINQYVDNGRSLLVCGQDPGDQRAGLNSTLLGQTDDKTFAYIGKNGSGGKYLRYAGRGDIFDSKSGLKAEQINDGIISLYPYKIDGSFTFSNHEIMKAAPYLLDFADNLKSEGETNSKVTVWYTFGSNDSKGSAYGISPRDARNNYYCYSKGNVVYLAQSEYAYYMSDGQSKPLQGDAGYDECRFFVNALFAAYSAGLHNAHINIVSGFASDAADIESISVPFDETWLDVDASDEATSATGGILDNTVDVFFKFRDSNIAAQKTTLVGFFYQVPEGEGEPLIVNGKEEPIIVNGKPVDAKSFNPEEYGGVWTVNDENRLVKVGDELQPGKTYRVEAPVITLRNLRSKEDENKADIYIVLCTTFKRNGRDCYIITADVVSLNRARLFRLE